jgi:hypothetical protein
MARHWKKNTTFAAMNHASLIERCRLLLRHPFFSDRRTLLALWVLLPVVAALSKLHSCNNFLIFRASFWHAWHALPLYGPYPAEYHDVFLYGPLFPLLVAPYAVVPLLPGLLMWTLSLSLLLYVAVRRSGLSWGQQLLVLWFCAHELLTALFMQQFNVAIAAIVLLSFCLTERGRDFWAAFFIVLGTAVKLYGVVGLAFLPFSRHKGRLLLSLAFWAVMAFVVPMLLGGPEYVADQYALWADSLTDKNAHNADSIAQNISLLGLVHRTTGLRFSDLWLIVPGLALFAMPYLRRGQYRHRAFRQTLLASVLMFCVLFSTGSESSGYIIALTGVALWYGVAPWQRSRTDVALMVLVFVLSSMSPSDLFPAYLRREWVQPYALKALPVALVWFKLSYELLTRDYAASERPNNQKVERHV